MFHINITEIVTVLVGGALLMVPVLGLTLRLSVPPILDAIGRSRARQRPAHGAGTRGARGNGATRPGAGRDAGADDAVERELDALGF